MYFAQFNKDDGTCIICHVKEEIIIDNDIKFSSEDKEKVKSFCEHWNEKVIKKLEIAKELFNNTKNIHLSFFIEEYISNFNEIQSNNKKVLEELDLFEYIEFDRCIEYINQSKFDITGWCLWEIPLSNLYLFYNLNRKESFDLIVNDKNIIPAYIDENSNEIKSNSIKEAIEKYIRE